MVFETMCFSGCSLKDPFYDSLREDYPDFDKWFNKKSNDNAIAHVHKENGDIQAFLYVKDYESEAVGDLPASPRMKIGTLKVCEDVGRRRIAEGAVGIALWKWQRSELDEIYVTIFPKYDITIKILKMFGFTYMGKNGEEDVYYRSKKKSDYSDPKKSFPYIDPNFAIGRYIPIDEEYHDQMFQYSDLKNTPQFRGDFPVSNGITKNYIATPISRLDYAVGDVVFIYRKHTGPGPKRYKSVVTSYCTITKVTPIKISGTVFHDYQKFLEIVGNKTVFNSNELNGAYLKSNVYVIEMVYNGYFGAGKNITFNTLSDIGLFDGHPYAIKIDRKNVLRILKMGGKSEHDIIVDQSRTC